MDETAAREKSHEEEASRGTMRGEEARQIITRRAIRVSMAFGDGDLVLVDTFVWRKGRKPSGSGYVLRGSASEEKHNLSHYLRERKKGVPLRQEDLSQVSPTVTWGGKEVTMIFGGETWVGETHSVRLTMGFDEICRMLSGKTVKVVVGCPT